jgi:hypothetical protein
VDVAHNLQWRFQIPARETEKRRQLIQAYSKTG